VPLSACCCHNSDANSDALNPPDDAGLKQGMQIGCNSLLMSAVLLPGEH